MHTVAVVQARMSSTRLPGKVMLPLDGEHVLTHDIRRLQAAAAVDEVVVATSTAECDAIVARCAERAGAAVHRGSETDVLGRMCDAARDHAADVVVRATADDALVPPAAVDTGVRAVCDGADYAANTIVRTFPQGLIVEAFSIGSFETVASRSTEPHQREHVTQYYLEHPASFVRENIDWSTVYDWDPPLGRGEVRLALDEPDDYELLRAIYRNVDRDERGIVPVRAAIEYVARNGLADTNRHVGQTQLRGDE
jgi:spore coat polysaccharide biosynthesis protein SpsF